MFKQISDKLDNLGTGLILGGILPMFAFLIIYLVRFRFFEFSRFLFIITSTEVLPKLLSLCVVPNLAVFFIFIWTNKYYSARGVLFATIIFSFIILLLKVIL
ncbi:MAG: hypothetical protein JXJ22_05180 [Bacteroidales bacterium]|nr:hypothetical protein [Bacteroidales bacterium]